MTPKQEAFVHHYCANGGNGTQAAIAAGYSESGASVEATRLLANARIKGAVDEWRAQRAERSAVTIENLTDQLQTIAEGAVEKQPAAAVSALNTIAKLHGLLTEDRKNERSPLKDVLGRIERENGTKPRLVAVK